jgi:O-acetyl-ADP-ribose deacetylase (regulator of RNase III)
MLQSFFEGRFIVKVGDITDEHVDAIVNAANSTLLGGGGVDGAIHRRGGPTILEECRAIRATHYPNGLPTGEAVITSAGSLPARFVIHTVGPIYGRNNGRDAELLADCYRTCIELANANDLSSVSFPSISTGAYGYPKHEAAVVAHASIKEMLKKHAQLSVALVFFSERDAVSFLRHSR